MNDKALWFAVFMAALASGRPPREAESTADAALQVLQERGIKELP